MKERFMNILNTNGFTEIETSEIAGCIYHTFKNDILTIFASDDFKAIRIDKPNRTHKWLYEKTYAQFNSILNQTMSFYR
jgi:hypothetical protein